MNDPIAELEQNTGMKIPDSYRQFLIGHDFNNTDELAVEAVGHYWAVDEILSREGGRSLLECFLSVSNAIPPNTFPLLSTLGGMILVHFDAVGDQSAYYWDHERDPCDHSLLKVADSAVELRTKIVPHNDDW